MKGTMTSMVVLAYAATAAGAEDFAGSRWVRTQGTRLPAQQGAFVAVPAPGGASTVSRGVHAGLQQTTSRFQAKTNSRNTLTRVMAEADGAQAELKVDCDAEAFSCQNAFFFAKMCDQAYYPRQEVKTFFQGNETVTGLGYEHFHWFEAPKKESEKAYFDAIQDTEAFVAANDDCVMAVFRGTMELTDWATNLDFLPRRVPDRWGLKGEGCDVHQGFDDGVNTVWAGEGGMLETIKKLIGEEGKNRKLYISGHSLGGALATIAGAHLAFEHDINIAGIYTIGSPRVFDGQLSEIFDEKMNHGTSMKDKYFRCRNNNDIVPRIVPPPYEHVGTEIYLNRNGVIKPTSAWDRLMGRYNAYMKLNFGEDIDDHMAGEYIRIFEKLAIEEGSA